MKMEYSIINNVGKTSRIYLRNTLKNPKTSIIDIGGTNKTSKNINVISILLEILVRPLNWLHKSL